MARVGARLLRKGLLAPWHVKVGTKCRDMGCAAFQDDVETFLHVFATVPVPKGFRIS